LSGIWNEILINDSLPFNDSDPIFSQDRKFLWISLLEKSYAKAYFSYENIS